MIRYVPTFGSTTAQRLTSALWSLARPSQVRGSAEKTTQLFGTITCLDKSVWLQVDTEYSIKVHKEAELDGIADIMQPLIDDSTLPKETNETLSQIIETHRDQRLVVWDAFPDHFKNISKTREDLVALKLLSNPTR